MEEPPITTVSTFTSVTARSSEPFPRWVMAATMAWAAPWIKLLSGRSLAGLKDCGKERRWGDGPRAPGSQEPAPNTEALATLEHGGHTGEPGVLQWGPHHQAVVAGGSGGVEGGPVRAHRRAWSPAVGTLPPGSGSVGGVAPFTDACSEMAIPSRQLPALTPTYGPRPKGTTNLVPSRGHSNPGLCPCLHHVPDGTMPVLAYFLHLPPAPTALPSPSSTHPCPPPHLQPQGTKTLHIPPVPGHGLHLLCCAIATPTALHTLIMFQNIPTPVSPDPLGIHSHLTPPKARAGASPKAGLPGQTEPADSPAACDVGTQRQRQSRGPGEDAAAGEAGSTPQPCMSSVLARPRE